MSKILYNPLNNEIKSIKYDMMKKMAKSLLVKGEIEDCLPALKNNVEGIYASTSNGGSKFWSFEKLTEYFKLRNNERMRIR